MFKKLIKKYWTREEVEKWLDEVYWKKEVFTPEGNTIKGNEIEIKPRLTLAELRTEIDKLYEKGHTATNIIFPNKEEFEELRQLIKYVCRTVSNNPKSFEFEDCKVTYDEKYSRYVVIKEKLKPKVSEEKMSKKPKTKFKVKRYISKLWGGIWKRQCRGCGRIVRTTNHSNEFFCRNCKE